MRQRWRLIFSRDDDARFLAHLDAVHLWERAFRRGDIPVATTEGHSPRPRLIFAAPLPLGMMAERELADLFLSERLSRADLQARLGNGMPRGYNLMDLHDVWVGAPALATQLVAADYRLTLLGADRAVLEGVVAALLRAPELRREKHREKKAIAYDLRPLVLDLQVRDAPDASADAVLGMTERAADLWMRLRHSQDLGSGRPEEVVAAIADQLGMALLGPIGSGTAEPDRPAGREPVLPAEIEADRPVLEIVRPVRERLWLSDELAL
jgi:radical SAM-linked protein